MEVEEVEEIKEVVDKTRTKAVERKVQLV